MINNHALPLTLKGIIVSGQWCKSSKWTNLKSNMEFKNGKHEDLAGWLWKSSVYYLGVLNSLLHDEESFANPEEWLVFQFSHSS